MISYEHKVQYYETDQMKVVHHSNYIRWFEEARIDYIEQLGIPYGIMEESGIISPVISVEAQYLRMVRFGDTMVIKARMKEYNGVRLTIDYEVMDQATGIIHCKGTSRHCFLNESGSPISLKREFPAYHERFQKGLTADKTISV